MGENIGFLGSGNVYLRRKQTDGTWGAWAPSGACDKFEVKAESEIKSQTTKERGKYGQTTDAVTLPKEPTVTIAFSRPNRKVLAAGLLGEDAVVTVTGASVTDEAHTCPAVGEAIRLAYRDVSSVVVTQSAAELVEGTDYELDAKAGFVTVLGGDATPESAWTVDYTYASQDGFRITGVTQPKVNCQFYFDGVNLVDESDCTCEVWDSQIAPSGGWDMLSNDHAKVELAGTCNTPTGKTNPYEVFIKT